MDSNLFSNMQIEYLYSDNVFLSFINQYFSSFATCVQGIRYTLDSPEIDDSDMGTYMRIVLANIDTLYRLVSDLDNCLSMANAEKEAVHSGEIRGKLSIAAYTRRMGQIRYPKEYPCVVKTKTYVTPENTNVIFIIKNILELLDLFKQFL